MSELPVLSAFDPAGERGAPGSRGRGGPGRVLVTALSLAAWPLLGCAVYTRSGLVRQRLLDSPADLAPEYVGIAVSGALVVLVIGLGVTLLLVQLLAWAADGLLARLWRRPRGSRGVGGRVAVGAAVVAAFVVDIARGDPASGLAAGVPLLLAPAFGLLGIVLDRASWAQATNTGKQVGWTLLLGAPVLTLISLGHPV